MSYTDEEPERPARGALLILGGAMAFIAILIAAALAIPIQPGLPATCAGCGSTTGSVIVIPPGTGSSTGLNYEPASAVVIVGQNNTVTFVNRDSVVHTVTATDKSFDSEDLAPGANWTFTFTSPGNYSFYCVYHSAWMKGTIRVLPPVGAGALVVIPPGTGSDPNQTYQPARAVVVLGLNSTVTFENKDGVPHTVTATDGSFDSGNLAPGTSWSHTFTAAGNYSYYCSYHSWMRGTVTVLAKG